MSRQLALTAKFLVSIPEVIAEVIVGFFSFGVSTKVNADHEAGYDPANDKIWLGGQAVISTQDDTTNLQLRRQDNLSTATGWADNTTIGRVGFIPVLKTGVDMFNTGSDGEALVIAARLHLEYNGETIIGSYTQYLFQVIADNDDGEEHPLFTVFEFSGKGGGEYFFRKRAPDGTLTTYDMDDVFALI